MDRQTFKGVRGLTVLVRVFIKRLDIAFRLSREENEERVAKRGNQEGVEVKEFVVEEPVVMASEHLRK